MNGSLTTVLSSSASLEKIKEVLIPLLTDPRKRGDNDISPVARELTTALMRCTPQGQMYSAEYIYLVSIAASVVNPGTPGLITSMQRLWELARGCDDFTADMEQEYGQLYIMAHGVRADADGARMAPRRRVAHERLCRGGLVPVLV